MNRSQSLILTVLTLLTVALAAVAQDAPCTVEATAARPIVAGSRATLLLAPMVAAPEKPQSRPVAPQPPQAMAQTVPAPLLPPSPAAAAQPMAETIPAPVLTPSPPAAAQPMSQAVPAPSLPPSPPAPPQPVIETVPALALPPSPPAAPRLSLAPQPMAQTASTPELPQRRPPAPQPAPAQTAPPAPQPSAARPPEYVEEKGFKGKIFDIKYRDPSTIVRTLLPLGSGFKGATMTYNTETRTLSVRDFPENIAAIEEALKRLDVPEAPRPDIEFSIHILIASNGPGADGEIPRELTEVVQQLKQALKYQNYAMMTAAIHHTKEGRQGVSNSGVADSKLFSIPQAQGLPTLYSYDLEDISLDTSSGNPTVNIGRLIFNMRIPLSTGPSITYQNVGFRSPVSLRQGEKVVVGSTTMGDKGLIMVVSTKILK